MLTISRMKWSFATDSILDAATRSVSWDGIGPAMKSL
jgi:hypothetical protein